MTTRPHSVVDLYLAPVTLSLDERLNELSRIPLEDLAYRVALETNREPRNQADRAKLMLATITHLIELHDWTVSWNPRGLVVSHKDHELVLGIPPNLRAYLED
jgi:hypothetical protein